MFKKSLFIVLLFMVSAFGMTKQELIDDLNTRFDRVGDPMVVEDTLPGFDIRRYQVPLFYLAEDSIGVAQSFEFYVKDEGLSTEAAFPVQSIINPTDTFLAAVKNYLENNQLRLIKIMDYNKESLWAECEVWWQRPEQEVFTKKRVFVIKIGQNIIHGLIN